MLSHACKDELRSFDSPPFNAITLLEISVKKDRYLKTNIQLYRIFNFLLVFYNGQISIFQASIFGLLPPGPGL